MKGETMKKKFLSMALALSMAATVVTGCGSGAASSADTTAEGTTEAKGDEAASASSSDEDPYELTFMYIASSTPEDIDKVQDAINDLTIPELNIKVSLQTVTFGNWAQQVQLMLSSGESLDVFPAIAGNVPSYIQSGYLVDMSDLLDEYGTNIKAICGEDNYKIDQFDGFVFGVPTQKEWANVSGWVMRKDICDELGIDAASLKTWDDMDEVFAKVHAAYPDMTVIGGYSGATPVAIQTGIDRLQDYFGVLENNGQDTTVTNWYASDTYHDLCAKVHEWYEAGYVKKDMTTSNDNGDVQMKAGNTFCFYTYLNPASPTERKNASGYDVELVPMTDAVLESSVVSTPAYSISYSAKDPVKCMQFLDWAYGSEEFETLINWGVEGEHWVYADEANNIITYPEGIDSTTDKYHVNYGFSMPNQMVGAIWEGNPADIWDQYKEFNNNGIRSKAFGFLWNPTGYENEISALTQVQSKYEAALGSGSVDPDEVIPQFVSELEQAGIDKVMAEKQKQLDAFLAAQGE